MSELRGELEAYGDKSYQTVMSKLSLDASQHLAQVMITSIVEQFAKVYFQTTI